MSSPKKSNDVISINSSDDSELVALGAELEKITPDLTIARAWVDEISELFEAQIEMHATWPADQDEWTYLLWRQF